MRSHLKATVVVAALAASPVAFAQWLPGHDYTLDRAGNVIHVRGPSITTPSYLVTGSTSGALVTSTKQVVIGNKQVAIQAAKNIPWKNVAGGVVRAARISPYSMAAGFAIEWLIDNGWRYTKCLESSSSCDGEIQWQRQVDASLMPVQGSGVWRYGGLVGGGYASAAMACIANEAAGKGIGGNWSYHSTVPNTSTSAWCRAFNPVTNTYQDWTSVSKSGTCPNGSSPNADGSCGVPPGPVWQDSPPPDFDKNPPNAPDPDKAPDIWDDALPGGIPDSPGSPEVSGPGSVVDSESTTTSNGQTTTNNITYNLTYNNGSVTITRTETTTNPDGSTTTTEHTVPEDPLTCGLPGMPACNVKVDEGATPKWEQPSNKALDDIKAADAVKLNEVAQTIPQPDLGWFGAPPIAACRKIVFPHGIGEADPCGVVDSVRSVMAYLWAIVAAWISFGWIRQAVNGG